MLKRPACKKPASLGKDTERTPWVKLRQVDPQKTNPRSYIQGMVAGGKMHLIVETSQKMSPHYKALIGKIREALEKDNLLDKGRSPFYESQTLERVFWHIEGSTNVLEKASCAACERVLEKT